MSTSAGGELTREQLLEYVKKQKAKIKKLEADLAEASEWGAGDDSDALKKQLKEKTGTSAQHMTYYTLYRAANAFGLLYPHKPSHAVFLLCVHGP